MELCVCHYSRRSRRVGARSRARREDRRGEAPEPGEGGRVGGSNGGTLASKAILYQVILQDT